MPCGVSSGHSRVTFKEATCVTGECTQQHDRVGLPGVQLSGKDLLCEDAEAPPALTTAVSMHCAAVEHSQPHLVDNLALPVTLPALQEQTIPDVGHWQFLCCKASQQAHAIGCHCKTSVPDTNHTGAHQGLCPVYISLQRSDGARWAGPSLWRHLHEAACNVVDCKCARPLWLPLS